MNLTICGATKSLTRGTALLQLGLMDAVLMVSADPWVDREYIRFSTMVEPMLDRLFVEDIPIPVRVCRMYLSINPGEESPPFGYPRDNPRSRLRSCGSDLIYLSFHVWAVIGCWTIILPFV